MSEGSRVGKRFERRMWILVPAWLYLFAFIPLVALFATDRELIVLEIVAFGGLGLACGLAHLALWRCPACKKFLQVPGRLMHCHRCGGPLLAGKGRTQR